MKYILKYPIKIVFVMFITVVVSTGSLAMVLWHFDLNPINKQGDSLVDLWRDVIKFMKEYDPMDLYK